jgi:hypothetical protein
MPEFALILSLLSNPAGVELTCAISGENDRWNGTTRTFASKEEAEKALRTNRVLSMGGPDLRLDALNSGIPVAIFVEETSAVELQVLHRVDPKHFKVRTFVKFEDKRGGILAPVSEEYWLDKDIEVGDLLEVHVAGFTRKVTLDKIISAETKKFGSDETRREVAVEANF